MSTQPFFPLRTRLPRPSAADALVWLAGALPLLLLVVLISTLLTLSPAHAATDTSCHGHNLLVAMEKENPAELQKIRDEAAKVPNGKGIFWKIEKPGVAPSWLLGTMHVTDPRVLTMPPGAREAAAAADIVVIESDEVLDEQKAGATLLMHPELTMFTDGTSIKDHIDAEDLKALEAGLKERGLALGTVSRMKPWILASFVALPACEMARKAAGASFLDKQIAEDAVKAGKPVAGLETMVEQLQAMADLPLNFHFEALIETIALGDKMEDVTETMTELYLNGDVGMTMPMLKAVAPMPETGAENGYAAFEDRIVRDRNIVMSKGSLRHLEKGNAFIAVGALHLPGEEGLVELFRKQGFTVTQAGR
ncbi:TraB/GumN family protein [Rhizobium wuzhouense]|uniref:Polysaccharide biosynthesis protein GumN n=1 Tax=Rhizobium wuzhouense TaxID=1986026 RepID=A0ABX5NRS6_9HYPH|nr:TraB/GumN family protein [Rhizobium wuzhouense]PYB74023.1 polysaccharide biosynthesis protein GumN [Rhizobium wuzhouense]